MNVARIKKRSDTPNLVTEILSKRRILIILIFIINVVTSSYNNISKYWSLPKIDVK